MRRSGEHGSNSFFSIEVTPTTFDLLQILLTHILAYEKAGHIKVAMQNGVPMLAVDVPNVVFDTLVKNASWIIDEEAWKSITASMSTVHMPYAQQVRDAAAKRKAEGFPYLLLYATREERMQILTLN